MTCANTLLVREVGVSSAASRSDIRFWENVAIRSSLQWIKKDRASSIMLLTGQWHYRLARKHVQRKKGRLMRDQNSAFSQRLIQLWFHLAERGICRPSALVGRPSFLILHRTQNDFFCCRSPTFQPYWVTWLSCFECKARAWGHERIHECRRDQIRIKPRGYWGHILILEWLGIQNKMLH